MELIQKDFGLIKELLTNVSLITNTEAICAGGAPRDLKMHNNISDYDIYIKTPNLIGNTLEDFVLPAIQHKLVEMFGSDVSEPFELGGSSYEDPWYEENYIHCIYEFDILSMHNIQFIFTNPKYSDLIGIAKAFPFSLSQAWITKDSDEINTTPLFDYSLEKRITLYNYKCKASYLSKMATKFRGFAMIPVNHELSHSQIPFELRSQMEIPF